MTTPSSIWVPVVGARGYEIYGRRYRDDDMEFMGNTGDHYYHGLRRIPYILNPGCQ